MCVCCVPVRYVRYAICVRYGCSVLRAMCLCPLLASCVFIYALSVLNILCFCMRVKCVFLACVCYVFNVHHVSIVASVCSV